MSMERRRQNNSGRWNTAQFLRSIEESQSEESERSRPVESTQGRSLVSRFGMSEISCFPSSRSRRSSDSQQQDDTRRRSASQKRGSVPQLRSADTNRMGTISRQQDRGKNQVFPRTERSGLMIRTNQLAAFDETTQDCFAVEGETSNYYNHSDSEHFDSEDQIFDLTLADEAALKGDRLHAFKTSAGSSSCKRKSYGVSARSGNNISGSENSSRDDHQHQRGSSLRRSSSSAPTTLRSSSAFANPVEGARPQKIRVSGRAVDAAAIANLRPTYTPGSRGVTTPQPAECHGLMNCHLEQQSGSSASASRPSCLLNSSSRSRRSEEARRFSPSLTSRSGRGEGSSSSYRFSSSASRLDNHDGGEASNASSGIVTRRNLSSCFGSQGRRSETSRQVAFAGSDSRRSGNSSVGVRLPDFASSSSSSSTQTPVSVLASGLEVMPSAASAREQQRSSSVASPEMNWSSSSTTGFGWEYHRPRLMAEGLAKILVALERVDELTHEQLLMLEATVLFGGMALHDQHRDWRMDVDNMSYEELLDLGDRIGSVNTGLNKELVSARLRKITFSSLKHRLSRCSDEYESKCSICQEEYEDGERLGWIDCGHQYHAHCITEWLVQKNICPICKATALPQ